MTGFEFDYIRRIVLQQSGIVIEPGKEYLMESRLLPLARREGLTSIQALIAGLQSKAGRGLRDKVVEAMTINETLFFRDIRPFEVLRTLVLPDLLTKRAKERRLRIWCGACSSGQEPYSLAMIIREHFPEVTNWEFQLKASDISREMVARARSGRYSQLEVNRGVPTKYLADYFSRHGVEWHIREDIRKMVDYFELNLAGRWPPLPPFDIVILRNVLIYFDLQTRREILIKVQKVLQADGYLLLGGSETTINISEFFRPSPGDQAGWYRMTTHSSVK